MPNIKSAKKRLRQSIERNAQNRSRKSELRTLIKKVRDAAGAGKTVDAEAALRITARRLDQAGAARVIHPNRAARLKSRLQKLIKSAKQPKAG